MSPVPIGSPTMLNGSTSFTSNMNGYLNGHVNGHTNGHLSNGVNGHYTHKSVGKTPSLGFNTRAVHIGSEADSATGAVIPPISLSTTYKQESIGVHKGFEYTRSSNPNRASLERALASIESGGAHALAFASGSATTSVILQSLPPNSHIISVNDVYGGTFRYMTRVAAETMGLQTTFLDLETLSDEEILSHVRENTKLVWIESPTNPTLRLLPLERLAKLFHSHPSNPLVLVDNTFLSPYFSSPLLLGADVVMHSLTKYINGHSDVLMGALILPSRHHALYQRLQFLQNATGAVPSAYDSWLAQRGLKTLGLRMKQHGLNALKVARFLEDHPRVERVVYPGLETHRSNRLAYDTLSEHARNWVESLPEEEKEGGFPFSGMVSFYLKPSASLHSKSDVEADLLAKSQTVLSSLEIFTLAESLGGVESLAEHPALMTHASIPAGDRERLGISNGLIRLSCGIEEASDLVEDLKRVLDKLD